MATASLSVVLHLSTDTSVDARSARHAHATIRPCSLTAVLAFVHHLGQFQPHVNTQPQFVWCRVSLARPAATSNALGDRDAQLKPFMCVCRYAAGMHVCFRSMCACLYVCMPACMYVWTISLFY
ncbi:MAG TPA: hypothetical protein V6C97_23590 [Oculatellaceae cyanobacterium]